MTPLRQRTVEDMQLRNLRLPHNDRMALDHLRRSCETLTVTVFVTFRFVAFVHVTAIVYTRPLPDPLRSARSVRVSGPVTAHSGGPGRAGNSLVSTPAIRQAALSSEVTTAKDTGTILPLGGHSATESAVKDVIAKVIDGSARRQVPVLLFTCSRSHT